MSKGKVAALKSVLAIAYADGTLSEPEQKLVDFLMDSQGLTPEEQAAVHDRADAAVDLDRLGELVTEATDRAWAYEFAALVSLMDGARDAVESALLDKLRGVLEIADDAAGAAEARAAQIYENFKQRQTE